MSDNFQGDLKCKYGRAGQAQYDAKKIRFVCRVIKAEIHIVVTFIVYKYLMLSTR